MIPCSKSVEFIFHGRKYVLGPDSESLAAERGLTVS